MRINSFLILFISVPFLMFGQKSNELKEVHFPRHYISVNPLNIIFFQQAGITYEYKPGWVGCGITTGYIYPNHKEYSNYFIAGPTNIGSLGDYSGFFVVPQVNLYLLKPKDSDHANLVYFSFKMVYKYMHIDSTSQTAWLNEGDFYYLYRKMIDKVNIYGGFFDFGYRYVIKHFFFDVNLGVGVMWVNHNMIVSRQGVNPPPWQNFNPPLQEEVHERHVTINFTLNLGIAL
jgi:hypothetical protein